VFLLKVALLVTKSVRQSVNIGDGVGNEGLARAKCPNLAPQGTIVRGCAVKMKI
jgi:hypothetical protein